MKYGLAAVAFVVAIFLALILALNRPSGNDTPSTAQPKGPVQLLDYDNRDATLTYTVEGRVVGDDQHKSIRISVNPSERVIEVLDGYSQSVETTQSYDNTLEAYQSFLRAVNNAGYAKSRASKITDYRGVCPFGNRYIYQVSVDGEEVSNTWSTSCDKDQGTFNGSAPSVRRLFQLQITDYNKVIRGVKL